MKKPHTMEIDFKAHAGYVRYSGDKIVGTIDVWADGQVAADLNTSDEIVGVEILGFDQETLDEARRFAVTRGLIFPIDAHGVLVAT